MAMNQASVIKLGVCVVTICLASYFMGPPLYWHFKEGLAVAISNSYSSSSFTCPSCSCDCSSQPLLYIPQGLSNGSFTDCSKHDPEVSEDAEKNYAELLSEELKLRETEALENQQRADKALLDAKKMTSQFQKEADKCSSGMETCEEAREKAETALLGQKKLTATWEQRARQRGWKDGAIKARSQSKGSRQTA